MSNESTSNTRHCDQCAVALTDENRGYSTWLDRCDRCHSRPELNGYLLDIAYMANQYYRPSDTVNELQHDIAELRVRVQELRKPVSADDNRVEHLWQKLWDALDGDIERDQTWDMFMDAIPGLPDYRSKTYSGTLVLKFYFSDIEIPGGTDNNWDIQQALYDAITDLGYATTGDEDEWEVQYDED
jgi:hypothetical protein